MQYGTGPTIAVQVLIMGPRRNNASSTSTIEGKRGNCDTMLLFEKVQTRFLFFIDDAFCFLHEILACINVASELGAGRGEVSHLSLIHI